MSYLSNTVLAGFGKAISRYSDQHAVLTLSDDIEALKSKSDAELAELGTSRDQIPNFVIQRFAGM